MSSVQKLLEFEGAVTWMYLDTAIIPIVTCGAGMALETVEEALTLPWDQPEAQVRADYAAVKGSIRGYRASWYARLTKSRLPESYIATLAENTLNDFRKVFKTQCPQYQTFPDAVKEALDDMMYNLGPYFLYHYPNFKKALLAGNWEGAAVHCSRKGVSRARNEYTTNLFLQAARPNGRP
jgi:GH24 family phage-related lysozyme (muramidase)